MRELVPLFAFELVPVGEIEPWGTPDDPTLSWFALTVGTFSVNVGEQQLFAYSPEVQALWGLGSRLVDYQVAGLARDMLEPVRAATTRMPKFFEDVARDAGLVRRLQDLSAGLAEEWGDRYYAAWRWYDERAVDTGYLSECPRVWFVRVGDEVRIRWDNTDRVVEGVAVWSATRGEVALPVERFVAECRDFADRLLAAMERRIEALASGEVHARAPVDLASLREQHEWWREQFSAYFEPYPREESWGEAEAALRAVAGEVGVLLG